MKEKQISMEEQNKKPPTPLQMAIRDSVKALLKGSDSKQKKIAQDTGITEATISEYARGKKLPRMEYAVLIADYLGISVDELIGHKNNHSDIKTLSELLAAIYAINEVLPLRYENNSLKFDNAIVSKYLSDWEALKSLSADQAGEGIIENWKKGVASNTSDVIIEYGYRTADEWSNELVEDFKKWFYPQINNGYMISVEGYPDLRSAYYPNWERIHIDVPMKVLEKVREKLDITILDSSSEESDTEEALLE